MIKIEHLTPRQMILAELLWTATDEANLIAMIKALPTDKDKMDATSLVKVMMWDTAEQELGLEEFASAAHAAITCAMR